MDSNKSDETGEDAITSPVFRITDAVDGAEIDYTTDGTMEVNIGSSNAEVTMHKAEGKAKTKIVQGKDSNTKISINCDKRLKKRAEPTNSIRNAAESTAVTEDRITGTKGPAPKEPETERKIYIKIRVVEKHDVMRGAFLPSQKLSDLRQFVKEKHGEVKFEILDSSGERLDGTKSFRDYGIKNDEELKLEEQKIYIKLKVVEKRDVMRGAFFPSQKLSDLEQFVKEKHGDLKFEIFNFAGEKLDDTKSFRDHGIKDDDELKLETTERNHV